MAGRAWTGTDGRGRTGLLNVGNQDEKADIGGPMRTPVDKPLAETESAKTEHPSMFSEVRWQSQLTDYYTYILERKRAKCSWMSPHVRPEPCIKWAPKWAPIVIGNAMARTLNRLTARQVTTLKEPGRHADGGGLYLRLTPTGARSWVFMSARDDKRIEIGLGAAATVSLAAARQLAGQMRDAVALGTDPRAVMARNQVAAAPIVPTFVEFAEEYISSIEEGWKNAVHRQQWRSSLRDHAANLADMLIDQVDTESVLAALKPIWLTKPETARRVRGRIERILDAAKVKGLRPLDSVNPAAWRGHLAILLPSQSKLERGHHPALPWKDAPAFMTQLRAREAISARCLEFIILTAARSGEALGATWGEVDLKERLWTIPAGRMKAAKEHTVPLSDAAIAVLEAVRPVKWTKADRIFAVEGTVRSNMAIAMLLRRMNYSHITAHGFRSTFRDWSGESTQFPREVIEHALAHTIANKAERAYRRETAIDKRHELMTAWANFLSSAAVIVE